MKTSLSLLLFLSVFSSSSLAEIQALLNQYNTDRLFLNRTRESTFSEADNRRMVAFYEAWQKRIGDIAFADLKRVAQVDVLLTKAELQSEVNRLARLRKELKADEPFLTFTRVILDIDKGKETGRYLDGEHGARLMTNLLAAVQASRKAVEGIGKTEGEDGSETGPEEDSFRIQAVRLAGKTKQLTKALESAVNHYAKFQPEFDWWVRKSWEKTKKALDEYEKFLREKKAGIKNPDNAPLIGQPVGEERINEMIKEQFIPYNARELIAIGEREFAWCEEEMKKAAAELGFEDWKKAL
ncbi:MAG: DUF885 family protein, partial [Verrucomicrobiota bacterium]